MLFIQIITMQYDKSKRSGETMRRINSVRFAYLPDTPANLTGAEYFLHDDRFRKPKAFPAEERFRVTDRVFVAKSSDSYHIHYTHRPAHQHFKPVFTLSPGEYGRIVYNERAVTFDGEWYYIRTTINFLSAEKEKYRTKMFCRKNADKLFEDMAYLRYCGDKYRKE